VTDSSKREYLRILSQRYQGASRKEKHLILSEIEKNLKMHRKSAIWVLNSIKQKRPKETRGRRRVYNDFVIQHLKVLWLAMGQLCSRRMKKALPRWLKHYEAPEVTKLMLIKMGKTTIDKYLKPYKAQYRRHWNSGTKSGRYIKTMIPIKPLDYQVQNVGQIEADTVHHCGGALSGVYAITLTVTDIWTSWTECRSMWGLSMKGVTECMSDIERFIPFTITTVCVDNGSEFLNYEFTRYFQGTQRENPVAIQRGRPYKKNDQCHVEQKNFTHVRELWGWERMDQKQLIELMNDIYRNEWSMLQNLFFPQMKLQSKLRVGAKYKKKYTEPMTPLERILASPSVAPEVKEKLRKLEQDTNPFELKKSIETKLKVINKLLNKSERDSA